MIVVDASVLVDFLLGRAATVAGLREEMDVRGRQRLHAPELIELETLNALRRMVRLRLVTKRRAHEAVNDLANIRLNRYPHAPLRGRVWELRDRLTAYDASYLALAEALHGSVLLTADAGLASRARKCIGPARVRRMT